MRRLLIICSVSLWIFQSCDERRQEKVDSQNQEETREVIEPLPKRVYNTVLLSRNFSQTEKDDHFSLELRGPSYKKAELIFSIIDHKNDTLFIRKIKGSDLIDDESKSMRSEEEQEKFFLEFMSTFFAETSFSAPPYTLNDPQRDGFRGNHELWEEIKDDTTAWCFEFSLSKKGLRELIAYSKKSDSVIVYDTAP